MAEQLDPERRRQLEEERDFLMQSLDDLELEHESGGIDDESYQELHDDYTARAAAVIRTLRDGVDVTPAPAPLARSGTRRRVVLVAGVVVFAVVGRRVARVRARCPPPRADVVGQLGGRADDDERGVEGAEAADRDAPEAGQRQARRLRPAARARLVRTRRTATSTTHSSSPTPPSPSTPTGPRATPTPPGSSTLPRSRCRARTRRRSSSPRRWPGSTRRSPSDPNYPDSVLLPRGVVRGD